MMEKAIIVAAGLDGSIGRGGDLPWHISGDLKYFKATTSGYPVIMGRKTYDSIGRPLPGRRNIVLTRNAASIEGVECVSSVQEAFAKAEGAQKCFVMGGASVYRELLPFVDKLYVTRVHTTIPDADAFFPGIDPSVWREESRSELFTDEKSGLEYEFLTYLRK